MAADNFDRAFKHVIGHEGGFTDDRRDRGNWTTGVIGQGTLKGTKYGISAMSYPSLDIRNLTLAQAKEIYRRDYWNRAKCDELPSGMDLVVFDGAVNSGVSQSVRWLQQPLGIKIDGLIGPATIEACFAAWAEDWEGILEATINNRWEFMQGLSTFKTYGKGWRSRILGLGKEARIWAREGVPAMPEPPVVPRPTPEAIEEDASAHVILHRDRLRELLEEAAARAIQEHLEQAVKTGSSILTLELIDGKLSAVAQDGRVVFSATPVPPEA